ncbi:hypothetical protein ACFIOY_10230 [Bradyrhizobium sp. TZ2]
MSVLSWHGRSPRSRRIRQEFIAFFWVSTDSQPDPFLDGFREGMRARGYVEGKNVVLELHYAIGNPQALREVASELRRGKIDLAVSSGPATRDDGGNGRSRPVCPER